MSLTAILFVLLLGVGTSSLPFEDSEDGDMGRQRRSILDFGALILCKAKTNPRKFIGYGCFCGPGGEGKPVDGLDRCCQVHDSCYGELERRFNIGSIASYITPYIITQGEIIYLLVFKEILKIS
ncbi:phospholipase A2 AP-PLA2-II-like [Acropora palmata]|uniref:phospholipase A2 AP-PLA2-II-like n=1 Tax=Acropora palmata TaxID=6131 RepID=UPI003DA0D0A1